MNSLSDCPVNHPSSEELQAIFTEPPRIDPRTVKPWARARLRYARVPSWLAGRALQQAVKEVKRREIIHKFMRDQERIYSRFMRKTGTLYDFIMTHRKP